MVDETSPGTWSQPELADGSSELIRLERGKPLTRVRGRPVLSIGTFRQNGFRSRGPLKSICTGRFNPDVKKTR
jgi:hypothetical protein